MKSKTVRRSAIIRLLAVIALPVFLGTIYFLAIRPSQLRWGATNAEFVRAMPGDDLVPSPSFVATRAITIDAKPESIWPWLAQMGYRRAGFYGYDLIENLGSPTGIRSTPSILPGLQHPKTGDTLPISSVASMVFGPVVPGSYLVWRGRTTPSDGSLVWALYPADERHTRLVCRIRLRYHWTNPPLLLLDLFTEFGDHVAVPKILLGIKGRAEGRPSEPLLNEAAEILVWLLALFELLASIVLLFRLRRCGRAWLLGFAAGLLLLFALYAHAPTWLGVALACCILTGLALASRLDRAPARPTESPS
jgi:hypothetical protein